MDALETILTRHSVRKYRPEPLPAEHLKQILEACRQAPSAANRQPWHFVVVGNPEKKARLAEACRGQLWMADAAYIIVGAGLPAVSEKWYRVDVAIALENLVLAAHALGYGTCWIGAFEPGEVKSVCGLPDDVEVVACTPLGVPDVTPAARPRKDWEQVFSADTYGQPLDV